MAGQSEVKKRFEWEMRKVNQVSYCRLPCQSEVKKGVEWEMRKVNETSCCRWPCQTLSVGALSEVNGIWNEGHVKKPRQSCLSAYHCRVLYNYE